MGKTIKARGDYWTVVHEEGDFFHAYPLGGGLLAFKIPKSDAVEESPPDIGLDCLVTIDGLDGDYPCKLNPHKRWNGWAIPRFTFDVVVKIAGELGFKLSGDSGNDELQLYDNELEEHHAIFLCEDGLYRFDGWCWEIVKLI